MIVFGHPIAPVQLGTNEWLFVGLASVIILAILGRGILREIRETVD